MVIYKLTNKKNGKSYIGQTTQSLTERLWQHSNRSPSQTHRSAIYNAIKKNGIKAFTIEIIATASSLEELNELEVLYIKKHSTLAPDGYNLLKGGDNRECHPNTKRKISKSLKGTQIKNRMNGSPKGRPVSEERRRRISDTLKGRPAVQNNEPIIDTITGVLYSSQKEAALALNVSRQTINQRTKRGLFKKSA